MNSRLGTNIQEPFIFIIIIIIFIIIFKFKFFFILFISCNNYIYYFK